MRNRIAWAATIALALALASLLVYDARGQGVEVELRNELEAWPNQDRHYQNATRLEGTVHLWAGPVHARVRYARIMWGASDAKITGTVLNAESGKVNERQRGAALYVQRRGVRVGWKVERRSVNHTWRHKRAKEGRHPWFPAGYRAGQRAADGEQLPNHAPGLSRPSIGYYDGARAFVGADLGGLEVELAGPLWRWKDLTLPWPSVTLDATYRSGPWAAEAEAQAGGPSGWAADVGVERTLWGPLTVGLRAGALDSPDWGPNLYRITSTISLDLSYRAAR